ncbi:hypothetical protein SAMN04488136_10565 [Vibrio xiamenensis]|uniref:Uncharacterized protein n=1 Tax=Vibrio xiamenensis TaxID=861298 RepID=A0A1G7YD85_9VIBR|nr:hypothetical protein [Vibrio xiamenensis]SDG94471.1 hypothetical protein SAMN04488136_10565 [Vibrio xiamenensis]
MPVQKLTPARLTQISIMLAILIAAFIWRTYQHQPQTTPNNTCVIQDKQCSSDIAQTKIQIKQIDAQHLRILKPSSNWKLNRFGNEQVQVDARDTHWNITTNAKQFKVEFQAPDQTQHVLNISMP